MAFIESERYDALAFVGTIINGIFYDIFFKPVLFYLRIAYSSFLLGFISKEGSFCQGLALLIIIMKPISALRNLLFSSCASFSCCSLFVLVLSSSLVSARIEFIKQRPGEILQL